MKDEQEVWLRQRIHKEIEKIKAEAEIDRTKYISLKELAEMLGPNIKSASMLPGLITSLGIKTVSSRISGDRNTWLTEKQSKLLVREILSHPAHSNLGEDDK